MSLNKSEKIEYPEACRDCAFCFKPSRLCRICKHYEEAQAFWADYDDLDYEPFEVI